LARIILTVLQLAWFKALMADLDQLDTEQETIKRLAPMANATGKDTPSVLSKAQKIFGKHLGIL